MGPRAHRAPTVVRIHHRMQILQVLRTALEKLLFTKIIHCALSLSRRRTLM